MDKKDDNVKGISTSELNGLNESVLNESGLAEERDALLKLISDETENFDSADDVPEEVKEEIHDKVSGFLLKYYEKLLGISNERPGGLSFMHSREQYDEGTYTLAFLLDRFSKESLLIHAKDAYGLTDGSDLTKEKIIDFITEKAAEPETFKSRMAVMGDGEIKLLQRIADCGGITVMEPEEEQFFSDLEIADTVFKLDAMNTVCAPQEVIERYKSLCQNEEFEQRRQKTNWLISCLDTAVVLYGIFPWNVLADLYSVKYDTGAEDLQTLLASIPDDFSPVTEKDGQLAGRFLAMAAEKITSLQGSKPFYIPTEAEIREISDKGFLLSSPASQKMVKALRRTFSLSKEKAEKITSDLYYLINTGADTQDFFDLLEKNGCVFDGQKNVHDFVPALMDLNSKSRQMLNRGHTPEEMNSKGAGAKGTKPVGPLADFKTAGPLADLKPSRPAAVKGNKGEKKPAVKVGRNDPCPCGSGKKYKHCCGRS